MTRSLPKTSPASLHPRPDPAPLLRCFAPLSLMACYIILIVSEDFLLLQMVRSTGRAGLRARCFAMETAAMGPMHATGARKVRVFFYFNLS